MKGQSIFFVHASHKTKSWWTFLSVLVLVFVPFLIVWLLCGEFNLLGNDWFIVKGASVWHGTLSADRINELAREYAKFHFGGQEGLLKELQSWPVGSSVSIDSFKTFFNGLIMIPLIALFIWSIAYPIILNATKVSGIDVIPFSVGFASFMLITIITGLIPQTNFHGNMVTVYWILRIVIGFFAAVGMFILANYFTNKYIASRPYAADIYFGYKTQDKENALAKEQLKENLDVFKKHKDQDESFIEIKEGE